MHIRIFFLLFLVHFATSDKQTVTVKGRLICESRRAKNVEITLMDHDTISSDDQVATLTVTNGDFEITGIEDESGTAEFYLEIKHSCNQEKGAKCKRIVKYQVPKKHTNSEPYNMHWVALDIFHKDETCK